MNKEQEVKVLALQLCTLPQKYRITITKCEECGNDGTCVRQKTAEALVKAGYGDVRAAVKEFAERVKMAFYHEFDELIPSTMADKIDALVDEVCGDDN